MAVATVAAQRDRAQNGLSPTLLSPGQASSAPNAAVGGLSERPAGLLSYGTATAQSRARAPTARPGEQLKDRRVHKIETIEQETTQKHAVPHAQVNLERRNGV